MCCQGRTNLRQKAIHGTVTATAIRQMLGHSSIVTAADTYTNVLPGARSARDEARSGRQSKPSVGAWSGTAVDECGEAVEQAVRAELEQVLQMPAMRTRASLPPVCPCRQYRYSAPGVATTL